jgi:hypothetical protein
MGLFCRLPRPSFFPAAPSTARPGTMPGRNARTRRSRSGKPRVCLKHSTPIGRTGTSTAAWRRRGSNRSVWRRRSGSLIGDSSVHTRRARTSSSGQTFTWSRTKGSAKRTRGSRGRWRGPLSILRSTDSRAMAVDGADTPTSEPMPTSCVDVAPQRWWPNAHAARCASRGPGSRANRVAEWGGNAIISCIHRDVPWPRVDPFDATADRKQ